MLHTQPVFVPSVSCSFRLREIVDEASIQRLSDRLKKHGIVEDELAEVLSKLENCLRRVDTHDFLLRFKGGMQCKTIKGFVDEWRKAKAQSSGMHVTSSNSDSPEQQQRSPQKQTRYRHTTCACVH